MSSLAANKLSSEIIEILLPEGNELRDTKIEYGISGSDYQITISQMYEYLPLNFGMLIKLSELLGTQDIKTEQDSWGGCETCDYGSQYNHELKIKNVTKNQEAFQELCNNRDWSNIK